MVFKVCACHELSTVLSMCIYIWGMKSGGGRGGIRKNIDRHLYFASCCRLSILL